MMRVVLIGTFMWSLQLLTLFPLHCILLEWIVLKTYDLMIDIRNMIGVLLLLTVGMLILKKSLREFIETLPKADQKEILSKKTTTVEVTICMDVAFCIKHPCYNNQS